MNECLYCGSTNTHYNSLIYFTHCLACGAKFGDTDICNGGIFVNIKTEGALISDETVNKTKIVDKIPVGLKSANEQTILKQEFIKKGKQILDKMMLDHLLGNSVVDINF